MTAKQNHAWNNVDRIIHLYTVVGMTQDEIASVIRTPQRTISRIIQDSGVSKNSQRFSDIAPFRTRHDGYEAWSVGNKTVYVHQLLAIAEGANPHEIFSNGKMHVHHMNGLKWDNRPGNIEPITPTEHFERHREDNVAAIRESLQYDRHELVEWIDAFVQEFGVVPSQADIKGWPGPCHQTYTSHFGSWTKAVKAAGHEPRGAKNE